MTEPHVPDAGRPARVLVVDDEPDMEALVRIKFRKAIRRGELDFSFAGDGAEALERLDADEAFDLVVTDLHMPRMDGLTLLRRLAARPDAPMAVVVTAYGDMTNIRAAMNGGAFDFLVKPIELDDLEITVRRTLDAARQARQARTVRALFGRYVSAEVVRTLLARPEAVRLGGETRTVTLLMSDLRGFSTASERLAPEQVVEILNLYLGRMADVVHAFGGTVNEFVGDAVLAVFGAPIRGDDDARRAVACAIAMQQAMGPINEVLADRGLPRLGMGVGVHTGEVVVGNIGSERRAKYGVVGAPVNLTARIESFTVGGQVLISEATLAAAGTDVQVDAYTEMRAKGFAAPMTVYAADAVGAPYDLLLPPHGADLAAPDAPIPVTFAVLDGKHASAERCAGRFVRLSPRGAVLHAERPLDRLSDLAVAFPTPGADAAGDLYAKVLRVLPDDRYELRFTAVPAAVADAIGAVYSSHT